MSMYKTISGACKAELTEKRSRFIANACFVDTQEKATNFINIIKKQNITASHNVYAYVLRENGITRSSDDGEPAKTAGLPVLEVILHKGITNCVIVVTRYFGGTLLGTGGLIRAYSSAASAVLNEAVIAQISECVRVHFKLDYTNYEQVVRIIQQSKAKIHEPQFLEQISLEFTALYGLEKNIIEQINELTRGNITFDISDVFYAPF